MTPEQLISDFKKNRKYGNIELVFKDGDIVFYKAAETFVPAYEKNSDGMPRRENGINDRERTKNY